MNCYTTHIIAQRTVHDRLYIINLCQYMRCDIHALLYSPMPTLWRNAVLLIIFYAHPAQFHELFDKYIRGFGLPSSTLTRYNTTLYKSNIKLFTVERVQFIISLNFHHLLIILGERVLKNSLCSNKKFKLIKKYLS